MRMIFIGRSMAGKTTLSQYLHQEDLRYHKTQTVQMLYEDVIDTPGEYLEQAYLRGALSVSAADANLIVLVQAANERGTMFSPGFSSRFPKPCIGVVTKSDLGTPHDVENAKKYLTFAGARKIFVTSSYKGEGFEELVAYLEEKKEEFARKAAAKNP